ncbi:hypothetical protein ACFQ07_08235 [Actinomadura adrarensis]|uniref:Uncharacterized protein n=1 Tax=Actinomadura adrarensis TaxID=1819600 RepID=A0ABW3CCJ6_9ACTN
MELLIGIGAVFALLLAYGVAVDIRARRKGKRIAWNHRTLTDSRRDMRAWSRGSDGNVSPDITWMRWRRRHQDKP